VTLSPYILAIIFGWVVSQATKYVIAALKNGSFKNLRPFYLSGNMPSAHSATVTALVIVIGLREGFDTAIFGLAVLFATIVMYDAMMVRRSSGEQGMALRHLLVEQKSTIPLPRAAKGHTPVEVAVGALLGVVIGMVVFFATK
jgi:acid phosphatase family membrane protein YuiD